MLALIILAFAALNCFGWQNDIDLSFREIKNFAPENHLIFLPSAQTEIRLGRFLLGDKNHAWFGGAEGDVILLATKKVAWRSSLNMETLADGGNQIYFRLVQVYYQTRMGISWLLGPGVLNIAYQHRCSHGADAAIIGRILIRSGLHASYHCPLDYKNFHFDVRAIANAYAVGQNADVLNQARGGSQINLQALWAFSQSWSMLFGAGVSVELMSSGTDSLYNLASLGSHWRLDNLLGAKLGMRYDAGFVKNDYALHFSQVLDTGLTNRQSKHSGLTFDIIFHW